MYLISLEDNIKLSSTRQKKNKQNIKTMKFLYREISLYQIFIKRKSCGKRRNKDKTTV